LQAEWKSGMRGHRRAAHAAAAVAGVEGHPAVAPLAAAIDPLGPPPSSPEHEDVIAMAMAFLVRDAVARLGYNLVFVTGGVLLVFCSFTLFPFRAHQRLEALAWSYIGLTFAAILTVMVQIKRNDVIARLTSSTPGERTTWDFEFVLKLIVFGCCRCSRCSRRSSPTSAARCSAGWSRSKKFFRRRRMFDKKPLPRPSLSLVLHPEDDPAYQHFADALHVPFETVPGTFSRVNAWWLADASLLSYWPPSAARQIFDRQAHLDCVPIQRLDTQAYVASHQAFALVAFRGTQPDSLIDVLSAPESRSNPGTYRASTSTPGSWVRSTPCGMKSSAPSRRWRTGRSGSPGTVSAPPSPRSPPIASCGSGQAARSASWAASTRSDRRSSVIGGSSTASTHGAAIGRFDSSTIRTL
jgi:hypothetical protein